MFLLGSGGALAFRASRASRASRAFYRASRQILDFKLKHRTVVQFTRNHCSSMLGTHCALKMTARACFWATWALEMTARACFEATWTLKMSARACFEPTWALK